MRYCPHRPPLPEQATRGGESALRSKASVGPLTRPQGGSGRRLLTPAFLRPTSSQPRSSLTQRKPGPQGPCCPQISVQTGRTAPVVFLLQSTALPGNTQANPRPPISAPRDVDPGNRPCLGDTRTTCWESRPSSPLLWDRVGSEDRNPRPEAPPAPVLLQARSL